MIVILVRPYVGFPNGTATTSRVTAYARGLAAAGEDVHVILLGPSELNAATALNTAVSGVHKGIPFDYTSGSTIKEPSFLKRAWRVISSLFVARKRIRELDGEHGVDAVLLYSDDPSTAAFFEPVCRSVGATYALDLCEMPYHMLEPGSDRDMKQAKYGRRFVRRFDLVVAITRYLADYARQHLRPEAETVVVPIMVDCDEYRSDEPFESIPGLITYVGMLNEKKDGVVTLMTAFSRVAAEFPASKLRLVGDSDDARFSNVPEYRGIADGLGIAERVEFTGQVVHSQIAGYLREAAILVLARPSSQQAEAGFPTKLGEYLASGRPTVVTLTSDIGSYLTDGVNAFLIPPDDVDALAAKLRHVLADPAAAEAAAAAGRLIAEEFFDYRAAGRVLSEAFTNQRARRNDRRPDRRA